MSLPEAATAALAQWNASFSAIIKSFRALPQPTKESIAELFNEEDMTGDN